jgi:hypothetical protein
MTGIPRGQRVIITVCFMAAVAALSLVPGFAEPGDATFIWLVEEIPSLLQKSMHFILYGILMLLLAWCPGSMSSPALNLLLALTISVSFGGVLEWCQIFVPGRFGTLSDVGLNASGALVGLLVALYFGFHSQPDSG